MVKVRALVTRVTVLACSEVSTDADLAKLLRGFVRKMVPHSAGAVSAFAPPPLIFLAVANMKRDILKDARLNESLTSTNASFPCGAPVRAGFLATLAIYSIACRTH